MKKELKVLKTELNVGAEKPFRILHMPDTHLTVVDPGVDSGRQGCFDCDFENSAQDYCLQAIDYAKRNNITILNTGDLLDYLSEGNFDFVKKHFANVDYMYAAGNHDFCHKVGEAIEDYPYKWEMIKRSAPCFNCNLYFYSRVKNGVNFVTLDDSYYLISDGQIELLKAEAARGYPIVLCMHVPIYEKELAQIEIEHNKTCAYLTGAPTELLATYPEHRRLQQTPDKATLRALDYIYAEPAIKAVIAGHLHRNHECLLENGIPQIVTHGSYSGFVREITFK